MLILLLVCALAAGGIARSVLRNNPMENPAFFEGDIIWYLITSRFRTAVPLDSQLWPNGIIPYSIMSDLESNRKDIESAMRHIESKTCIKFIKRTSEQAYVRIYQDEGCFSFFGRAGTSQPLSLGDGCLALGIIVHELNHAIGLLHEHNRSDRDEFIEIFWDNIDPDFEDQFEKYRSTQNLLINDFDYTSIMMYGEKAYSIDGVSKTMKATKPGVKLVEVSDKKGLSASDITRINKLYKCRNL